jgi:hypothetical protein
MGKRSSLLASELTGLPEDINNDGKISLDEFVAGVKWFRKVVDFLRWVSLRISSTTGPQFQ